METGNAKRQSQPGEFEDATSRMREETSTSAFVALIATNAILLLMFVA